MQPSAFRRDGILKCAALAQSSLDGAVRTRRLLLILSFVTHVLSCLVMMSINWLSSVPHLAAPVV